MALPLGALKRWIGLADWSTVIHLRFCSLCAVEFWLAMLGTAWPLDLFGFFYIWEAVYVEPAMVNFLARTSWLQLLVNIFGPYVYVEPAMVNFLARTSWLQLLVNIFGPYVYVEPAMVNFLARTSWLQLLVNIFGPYVYVEPAMVNFLARTSWLQLLVNIFGPYE